MQRVLVSSSLVGQPVRHNGKDAKLENAIIARCVAERRIVTVCPELAAGLNVPRPAAEITGTGGVAVLDDTARVVETGGKDVTDEFVAGARRALELASAYDIRVAVLTDGSPSCGTSYIYDGTFRGGKIYGEMGVTAALL